MSGSEPLLHRPAYVASDEQGVVSKDGQEVGVDVRGLPQDENVDHLVVQQVIAMLYKALEKRRGRGGAGAHEDVVTTPDQRSCVPSGSANRNPWVVPFAVAGDGVLVSLLEGC